MRRFATFVLDTAFLLLGRAAHVVFHLFGWRFISFTGKLSGDIVYLLNRRKRTETAEEIRLLFGARFGEERIKGITRRSFENYYRRQVETVFFGSLDRETIERIIRCEGRENLDGALEKGKGVILLLSHFGSFLLPLPYLGFMGYRVDQVTGRQIHASLAGERFWEWRKREAEKLPVRFLQVGRFLRPLYQALGRNETVAIAFDGRDGSRWAVVDFFGRKARFSTGPFELARRTGAAIIPTFVVREADNTHRIVLEPPFELSDEADTERALAEDTRRFAGIFSRYIGEYPCHFGAVLYIMKKMRDSGIKKPLFVESYGYCSDNTNTTGH